MIRKSFSNMSKGNSGNTKPLIGFAGPRVIEQTVGEKLPDGFQRSEFLKKHGSIDLIVNRNEQSKIISQLIAVLIGDLTREE